MNKILTKVLEELRADKPRIDYVIGMLETLIEMQGHDIYTSPIMVSGSVGTTLRAMDVLPKNAVGQGDEATVLDGRARAAIEAVRALSEASTEK